MPSSDVEIDERTAPEKWVDELWERIAQLAAGHSGDVVVRLLRDASTEVWEAGLDHAFEEIPADDLEEKAPAFDITWLTVLLLKLAKEPPRKNRKQLRADRESQNV